MVSEWDVPADSDDSIASAGAGGDTASVWKMNTSVISSRISKGIPRNEGWGIT